MAFSTLTPLLTSSEVKNTRDFIIESSREVEFFKDPKGGKLSLSSESDVGYSLIFNYSNSALRQSTFEIIFKNGIFEGFLRRYLGKAQNK